MIDSPEIEIQSPQILNNQSKTFLMDCMEVMKQFPDKYFDLAVVDPPYGIGEDGSKTKGRTFRKDGTHRLTIDKRNGRKSFVFNDHKDGNWDKSQPDQEYFDMLMSKSKKAIIWGGNYLNFSQKNTSTGTIVWNKINFDNDFSDGEIAWTNLFSSVRIFEFMWNGMLQGKSITEGRINQGNKSLCEKRIHPTQKPVALYDWIFKKYATPGMKILDTHLGSQSSRISAHKAGMDFTGFELDPDYFKAGEKRFQDFISQLTISF